MVLKNHAYHHKQAHSAFFSGNPERKIGLTLFQTMRPKNVRLMGSVPIDSCLCIYCTNIQLKENVMNQLLLGSGQIPTKTDMLNILTCPHEQRWSKIDCINRSCSQSWRVTTDINEPGRGTSFVQHLFTAYWQYLQFKSCRLNPKEVMMASPPCQGVHSQVPRTKIPIWKLTIWSDGAASQYKGQGSFHDLTPLPHSSQRYYESEHGKGEADGETSILVHLIFAL
ncbi:hypothetical protein RRG08_022794 [Elysia crispata]|uniref:Uncharacterized protein n=1 Tax=Elysia crispata TaxID=231223 RepID=A0AAE0Z0D2_9GAST|nr:hypothetical protein RRG08_022794 [Elysia crispata]